MSRRALMIIDLQNDYFPGGRWVLQGTEAAADQAARLLGAARAAGDLVVHVRHEMQRDDAPFFAAGSEGAQIHHKVRPLSGEPIVVKHQINAFRDTDLKKILDAQDVTDLLICGAMSHICIDAATRAAADFGYRCTVASDSCATLDVTFDGVTVPAAQVHASFMAGLAFGYATVLTTDACLSLSAVRAA